MTHVSRKLDGTEEAQLNLAEGLTVRAKQSGIGRSPWAAWDTYRYVVEVSAPDATEYHCEAWGSLHDFERGYCDAEGIAWMVLDELLSAAYDPDEFWSNVFMDRTPSREETRKIENMLQDAESLSAALEANEDAISDHR